MPTAPEVCCSCAVRVVRGLEIYTMTAAGEDIQRVTDNRVPDRFPDWQPVNEAGGRR